MTVSTVKAPALSEPAEPTASPTEPSDSVELNAPELTVRAIITGMVLGGVLSLCNIYAGLKIGWGFNMSITAALLGFGFWAGAHKTLGTRRYGMLENNINQTAASSAASVSSAGLVAPIPALAMITGQTLSWHFLSLWVFSVCLVGIVVAVGLRRQMLVVDKLPFPNGVATAETVKKMYDRGGEAMEKLRGLLAGAAVACATKLAIKGFSVGKIGIPGSWSAGGALTGKGIQTLSLKNLTLALDPSLLMVAVGALIGMRACASLMVGAVGAWAFLAPVALEAGWADPGQPEGFWFQTINKWILWPGVAMMVTASLTSFAFSWRSVYQAIKDLTAKAANSVKDSKDVPKKWFIGGIVVAFAFSIACQVGLFDIGLGVATIGVVMTFAMAVVAARVSGETGITPVGPMGKVTQLAFGVLSPGNATANLMAANVTGGAASQAGDLLHDMKTGQMIGATPKFQALAQVFGAMAGALCGSAAYLVLVPNPKEMLLTNEWPAPAVAAWKAVAEIFSAGIDAMPQGAMTAMMIAGSIGIVLAIIEKVAPKNAQGWMLSPTSIGLAMVIPAWISISMFIGGVVAVILHRVFPDASKKLLIVVAAGIIAGESLTGVGLALYKILAA